MSLTAAAAVFFRRGDSKESLNSSEDNGGDRFDRTAARDIALKNDDLVVTIHGVKYDMKSWAKAHPGGPAILKKYHKKDATRAFDAVGHSDAARDMLKDFVLIEHSPVHKVKTFGIVQENKPSKISQWKRKLFTAEDPCGIHKSMGLYCLVHYFVRYAQMIFGDPSAGLGTRMGQGAGYGAMLCVLPHAILSMSSLIFHTVPRERIVGKPMIWQEFRAHNIIFGTRSVLTTLFAWIPFYFGSQYRSTCVIASCITLLSANAAADWSTAALLDNSRESTTATMPYWEGCSLQTQRKFKHFYALCQFLATLACVMVSNPAWPLCVLLPIQLASLLMTLVRKGLISTWHYHMIYTWSLCMPYVVGLRQWIFVMQTHDFFGLMIVGTFLYQMRRRGFSKYTLWIPILMARIVVGDKYINTHVW